MSIIDKTLSKLVGKNKKTALENTVPKGAYAKVPKGKFVSPKKLIR